LNRRWNLGLNCKTKQLQFGTVLLPWSEVLQCSSACAWIYTTADSFRYGSFDILYNVRRKMLLLATNHLDSRHAVPAFNILSGLNMSWQQNRSSGCVAGVMTLPKWKKQHYTKNKVKINWKKLSLQFNIFPQTCNT